MSILNRVKNAILPLLPILLVICATASESKADVVGICDPDGPGQCTMSVSITGNIVTITLTNTSPPANGGFITAAAFNLNPGTVITNFATTNANFDLFEPGEWSGNVAPNGIRTHLIGLDNNYEGGGPPGGGVPPGGSVTFTLTLADLNGNTETSIFNSLLVRSRGFEDGGSDKDPGITTEVPEPASMLLLGTGLLGVAAGFRKRYGKK